ncbi:MAG: quinol:electron acceptor oxidoreductase subunit ActD, partial [Terriglobia bacterium]
GFLLSVLTQKSYPLATGGMPIVTLWANGIITYEMTMLGAILTTLFTLLVTARIPDWRAKIYDPAVSEGKILVGVVNPREESRVELKRRLSEAGAAETKEVG